MIDLEIVVLQYFPFLWNMVQCDATGRTCVLAGRTNLYRYYKDTVCLLQQLF